LEVLMTLDFISFIIGAILLAVGILGGGIEGKEIKIPKVTPLVRILSGCIGLVFILLGLWIAGIIPRGDKQEHVAPDLIIENPTHSPETPTTEDTLPVYVPEVRSLMLESARKILERKGFRVGQIWTDDTKEPFNIVVSSSPAAGAQIDPGSVVDLTISWTRDQAERLVVQNWINAAIDKDLSRLIELSDVPFYINHDSIGQERTAHGAKDLRDVASKILLKDWTWYRGVVPVIWTREGAPAKRQWLYDNVARKDDHLAMLGDHLTLIVRRTSKIEVRVVGLFHPQLACFVSGTLVETPNGLLAIECIRPGDIVFTFDTKDSAWAVDKVTAVLSHVAVGDFVQIGITGGVTFKATGSHPIWVSHGSGLWCRPAAADVLENESVMTKTGRWVEARDLKRGDVLVSRSGPAFVETIGKTFGTHQVHTILLERYRGYAVSRAGIVVHMEEIHQPR
jgi:hypothetical protein